ncbi:hypothetical protein [Cytobacillus firmus]|uniref:hypothetical protein n=1 Tax=Cytobacillus firmus TaxID=1399 RepID=UPI0030015392
MWMFIGLLSFVAIFVFLTMSLVAKIKKSGKAKKMLLSAAGAFALMIVALSLDSSETQTATMEQKEESKEEKKKSKEEEKVSKEEKNETVAKEDKDTEAEAKKKSEEKAAAKKTEEQTNTKEKNIYLESYKPALTEITKEYDAIWENHWRPAWEAINNDSANVNELASNMDAVTDGYTTLSSKIIDFNPKGLSKEHIKLLEDYRVNMGKAISYRSNAGRAITQAIEGVADTQSRIEEATKSIELADKYMLEATVSMVTLETELGILE